LKRHVLRKYFLTPEESIVMTYARFTIAYWCILVMGILPIVCAGISKYGMFTVKRQNGGYDNNNPRAWLSSQSDWRARANAAQANTFEALPLFFAAVIIAHVLQASQARLDILAFAFVLLRVAYVVVYVADMANTRTALWGMAFLVNVAILFAGYR
jgi:uncharacterized MAPEG superfamily protein